MTRSLWAASALLCIPLACGDGESPGTAATEQPITDGELRFPAGSEVARLELEGGQALHFIELEPGAVGVLEIIPAGRPSIAQVPQVGARLSTVDLFRAFAAPGQPLPERLRGTDEPRLELGDQGWARPLLAQVTVPRANNCPNSTVTSWVGGFGYNDRSTPVYRLDAVPSVHSAFVPYVENWTPGFYFWEYDLGHAQGPGSIFSDVDRYATYVVVCTIDTTDNRNPGDKAHPSITTDVYHNPHMGPYVRFSYRTSGVDTGSYTYAAQHDFTAAEAGQGLAWYFNSGTNWDWRTEIHWAGGDDSFDIGHAVEDL